MNESKKSTNRRVVNAILMICALVSPFVVGYNSLFIPTLNTIIDNFFLSLTGVHTRAYGPFESFEFFMWFFTPSIIGSFFLLPLPLHKRKKIILVITYVFSMTIILFATEALLLGLLCDIYGECI